MNLIIYLKKFIKKNFIYFYQIFFQFYIYLFFIDYLDLYIGVILKLINLSLIFLLLICISTDIGGFFFGKLIGGKKLTKISPNKTYSGMIGSFIFSLIFGYLFFKSSKKF